MATQRTYLDYNASAPLRIEVRAAVVAAMDLAGNASSVHAEGRRARAVIEAARTAVAALVGARTGDVVFTSGATEANVTVVAVGWDTIFLSALEHDSVRAAARRCGARVVDVPVTCNGVFDVAAFAGLIGAEAVAGLGRALVCVQLANNETGVIQPVAEVAALARTRGVRVHCDAVQAPGRLPVDCTALGVDYLTVSAHKLGGPKGVGALVIVDGVPLAALVDGGGQERGRRAGTENVAGIAGFGAAAQLALRDLGDSLRVRQLRDHLEREIAELTPGAVVLGGAVDRLGNTSCIALAGLASETAVIRMDLAGVAISAGAACSSGKMGHSVALSAMRLDPQLARAAIRVSFGYGSTAQDAEAFLAGWAVLAAAHQRAA